MCAIDRYGSGEVKCMGGWVGGVVECEVRGESDKVYRKTRREKTRRTEAMEVALIARREIERVIEVNMVALECWERGVTGRKERYRREREREIQ
jgi:hypothetical protein